VNLKKTLARLGVLVVLVCMCINLRAQITVTTGVAATALVQKLVGTGVTFTGATLTCNSSGSGSFLSTNVALGLDSGIVLTTGYARNTGGNDGINNAASVLATHDRNTNNYDADLYASSGLTSTNDFEDLCKLEFDFVPQGDTLTFKYKFASEEYPDYNCSDFNDIFAFFIQGGSQFSMPTNLALVPGTTIPVAINSINDGSVSTSGSSSYCTGMGPGSPFTSLYYNNAFSTTIVYDGFTTLLTAKAVVTPCSTYHMKFAIADIFDGFYDSGVFLKAGSFSTQSLVFDQIISPTAVPLGWPYTTEGCNTDTIIIKRPNPTPQPQTVYINVSGTATNGVDVSTIPATLIIPANDTIVKLVVTSIADGIQEGTETLVLGISATSCSSNFSDTLTILVNEFPSYLVTDNDTVCIGQSKILTATVSPPDPYISFKWNPGNVNAASINILPLSTITYTVTASYPGCPNRDSVVKINVSGYPTANAGPDSTICTGGSLQLAASATSSILYPISSYSWTPSATLNNPNISNPTATPAATTTYTVVATNIAGCSASDAVAVTVKPNLALTVSTTGVNCANQNGSITLSTNAPGGSLVSFTLAPTNITNFTGQFTNLSGGITYTITASNPSYCIATSTMQLTGIAPMTWNNVTSTDISCHNGSNASISASVNGGTGTVNFVLQPVNITNQTGAFTALAPGVYTLTATDGVGCSVSTTLSYINPLPLTVVTSAALPNSCSGQSLGSISFVVSGGTGQLLYSLNNNTGITSGNYTGLLGGSYTIVATDNKGCNISATYNLADPPLLSLSINQVTAAVCNPSASGGFVANAVGGTGMLTYIANSGSGVISNGSAATFSSLTTQTYTVTVTDTKGCTSTSVVNVGTAPLPNVTAISTTSVSCNGGSNGTINVTIANGTGTITYLIAPSAINNNNGTFSGTGPGTYTVTASDINACSVTATVLVAQPTAVTFGATTATGTLCNSVANGTITTTASGGSGTISYTLLNTSATNTNGNFGALIAAVYSIQATDANGCTSTTTVAVTQPSSLNWGVINVVPVSCNGGGNGSIVANTIGGTGIKLYSINGNTPAAINTYTNLIAGNYTIVVSDVNGCNLNTVVTLTQPAALNFSNVSSTPVSCNPGNDATITAVAQGGNGGYTYSLNGGSLNATGIWLNKGASLYTIAVSDSKGCSYSIFYSVIPPSLPVITNAQTTNTYCVPNNTGTCTLAVLGNGNPLQYSVGSGFVNGNQFSNLSQGTYTATATDNYNCSATLTFIVSSYAATPFIAQITDVSCYGCDGTISLAGNWSGFIGSFTTAGITQTQTTFSMLCQGTYTVTHTETTGCTYSVLAIVDTSAVGTLGVPVISNISCNGLSDGTIAVAPTGGNSSTYSISLNGSSVVVGSSHTFTGLAAGTYTISATDALGCTTATTTSIINPSAVLFATVTASGPQCFGGNNGSISCTASGGSGLISYTILNAATQSSPGIFTGITGNSTYTLTATDANGCTSSSTIGIASPALLQISAMVVDSATCFGSATGSITISSVSGGTGSITYQLLPGNISNSSGVFSSLTNGSYIVTVTDANACQITTLSQVFSPTPLAITAPLVGNVSCNGFGDGTLSVSATGSVPSYTYSLNGGSSSLLGSFSGLSGGSYTLVVTDSKGCVKQTTAAITEPSTLTLQPGTIQDILCYNANNGSIAALASGGTQSYTYTLYPVLSTNASGSFTGLAPNTYTVQVSDANACTSTVSYSLSQPNVLSIDSVTKSNPTCSAGSNSNIQVYSSGGTLPKTYAIQPGAAVNTTGTFTGLAAGTYTINILDANNCPANTIVTLTAPTPIVFNSTSVSNVNCNGDSTGTLSALASGGTGALLYTLNPGSFSNSTGQFTNLYAALYQLTVSDANGCTISTALGITENPAISWLTITAENPRCAEGTDGSITIVADGGAGGFTYQIGPSQPTASGSFTNLGLGAYVVTSTDNRGCTLQTIVVLNTPQNLIVTAPPISTTVCPEKNNATLIAQASFGNPGGYIYSCTPGVQVNTTGVFPNLGAGNYTITVTDSKGCSGSTIAQVIPTSNIVGIQFNVTPISCIAQNGNDGIIIPTATNGVPPYLYYWPEFNDTATQHSSLLPGTYAVLAVDAAGCSAMDSVTLAPPPCCEVFLPNAFSPDGNAINDVFVPIGAANIEILQFDVYDRWGNQVFNSSSRYIGWDGTRKGSPLDMDTYFYILRYNCLYDGKLYKYSGDVILLR
jgi:large repetitive protein